MIVQKVSESVLPELLVTQDNGYVKARWLIDFGTRSDAELHVIQNRFERLYGVEFVKMKRYSASIEIADHVTTYDKLVANMQEAFEGIFVVVDGALKGK